MKNLSIMLKPVSSICNMKCKYCFYEDVSKLREIKSYGILDENTLKSILANIKINLISGDKVNFLFQGGEPTLAGLNFYEKFVFLTKDWLESGIEVSYSLQTNALLLDEKFIKFLVENKFLVGISLDLENAINDRYRLYKADKGTWDVVLDKIDIANKYGLEYNILSTLTKDLAFKAKEVFGNILKYNFKFIQFTPCINIKNKDNDFSLSPYLFADFYKKIFKLWLEEYNKNNFISIKLFEDIYYMKKYGVSYTCGLGGNCSIQLVVEANGNVYPCDFYCVDEYLLGNLVESTIKEIYENAIKMAWNKKQEVPKFCRNCKYLNICAGNCKKMRIETCFDDITGYCGYREILDLVSENLVI